jgi:hypothetical protein
MASEEQSSANPSVRFNDSVTFSSTLLRSGRAIRKHHK